MRARFRGYFRPPVYIPSPFLLYSSFAQTPTFFLWKLLQTFNFTSQIISSSFSFAISSKSQNVSSRVCVCLCVHIERMIGMKQKSQSSLVKSGTVEMKHKILWRKTVLLHHQMARSKWHSACLHRCITIKYKLMFCVSLYPACVCQTE